MRLQLGTESKHDLGQRILLSSANGARQPPMGLHQTSLSLPVERVSDDKDGQGIPADRAAEEEAQCAQFRPLNGGGLLG